MEKAHGVAEEFDSLMAQLDEEKKLVAQVCVLHFQHLLHARRHMVVVFFFNTTCGKGSDCDNGQIWQTSNSFYLQTVEEKQELEHKLADAMKQLATRSTTGSEADTVIKHLQEELKKSVSYKH